jgi:hypothetical protein
MSDPQKSPEPAASSAPEPAASRPPDSTRTGPGRLLVAIYGLFALSASARAGVQIVTKFSHAPVAYLLSAFAAVVYILATVTLSVGSPTARRIALLSCSTELVGVLAVGTWSLADPATFPDATVWSGYGSGYGYVPLVLPVFGLLWLRHWAKRPKTSGTIPASAHPPATAAPRGAPPGDSGAPGQSAVDVAHTGHDGPIRPLGSRPGPARPPRRGSGLRDRRG